MFTIVWHDHFENAEDKVVRQTFEGEYQLMEAIHTLLQNSTTESITIFPRTTF